MVYRNLTAIDPDGKRVIDIEVEEGRIKRVGKFDEGVDLQGAWVLPALIDCNVTLFEGKLSGKNLKNLAKEAKKGGVATLCLRPDIEPPLSDEITLEFINAQKSEVDIYPLLLGTKEEGLSEIATLARVFAKAIFVHSDTNSYLLARIFEYAKMLGMTLFVSVRNSLLRSVGVMNEGEIAFRMGLGGISKLEEYSEVARVVEFSEFYNVPVVFQDISTARAIDLIAQSSRCYAELSIHHLLKSDEECEGYNTFAKLSPPLREREEQEALLERLAAGKVDFLTSLHSPKPYTQKDLSFDEAAYGIDAISYYLPLAYTKLVKSGIITLEKLLELTSANPAAKLGIKAGFIKCGYEAKLILFDPEAASRGEGLYTNEEIYGRIKFIEDMG